MRAGTVAFLGGIAIFLQFTMIPPRWLMLCLLLVCLGILILSKNRPLYRFSGLIVCGFLWAMFRADLVVSNDLVRSIEGDTVIVTGHVVSLPEIIDSGTRFEFLIDAMRTQSGSELKTPGKVRLGWYRGKFLPRPGEYWQLHVRLKRPYGFSNPGGFDYEAWLFQHRIRATGYVRNDGKNILLDGATGNLEFALSSINHQRYLLRDLINRADIDDFGKSFLLALGLGDRSKIDTNDWQTLTQTGTSHLLAISGLHIGLVAGVFFFMGRWLWTLSGNLPLKLAAQRFAAISGLSGAFIYAALAGFSIPTQRALIMLTVLLLSVLFNRKIVIGKLIALSLLVVLIIDPFATMDAGFWLSFVAISIIAYGMTCRVHVNQTNKLSDQTDLWWKWGRVQYLVAIGLLPVLVLWFQQYPLLGIVANIVAVPYVSLIVVPLTLLGIVLLHVYFPVGELVCQLAGQALEFLWPYLEYLSNLEITLWQSAAPSLFALAAGMTGVLIILLPKGFPARWLGMLILLPLLFPQSESPQPGEFWLTQLDVGQGLAAVIQTQNHALIYDTGDRFSAKFNAGRAVIIPFLKQQNIQQVDKLIVSHGDRDHIGGAKAILEQYPDILVLSSATEKIQHAFVDACVEGQRWRWDGVDFEILNPLASGMTAQDRSRNNLYEGNNNSCVLKVGNDKYSVLLTGDIEQATESRLIRMSPEKLSVNVLIAPHHGSRTSSSAAFIDKVSPAIVVFPVGYRNRFGFPKQDIISRYESRQVKILNTARDGALSFRFTTAEMTVSRHRQQHWRFWMSEY